MKCGADSLPTLLVGDLIWNRVNEYSESCEFRQIGELRSGPAASRDTFSIALSLQQARDVALSDSFSF